MPPLSERRHGRRTPHHSPNLPFSSRNSLASIATCSSSLATRADAGAASRRDRATDYHRGGHAAAVTAPAWPAHSTSFPQLAFQLPQLTREHRHLLLEPGDARGQRLPRPRRLPPPPPIPFPASFSSCRRSSARWISDSDSSITGSRFDF